MKLAHVEKFNSQAAANEYVFYASRRHSHLAYGRPEYQFDGTWAVEVFLR